MTDTVAMEDFSFRWGVDLFDNARTEIPNWILWYYHRVPWQIRDEQGQMVKEGQGISNTEMMFIFHLASFKHEHPDSQARPSLTGTLRVRMNYKSNQGIINIEQALIDKGLLLVEKRPGRTSIYNFVHLSKKIIAIALREEAAQLESSTKLDDPQNESPKSSTKLDDSQSQKPSTKLDDPGQESSTNLDSKSSSDDIEISKEKLINIYEADFPKMTPGQRAVFGRWFDNPDIPPETIEAALMQTIATQPERPFSYLTKVVMYFERPDSDSPLPALDPTLPLDAPDPPTEAETLWAEALPQLRVQLRGPALDGARAIDFRANVLYLQVSATYLDLLEFRRGFIEGIVSRVAGQRVTVEFSER